MKSGYRVLEGKTFGLGIYRELTRGRAADRFRSQGIGFTLSYDQAIRGPWSGGIQVRWSNWEPHGGVTDDKPVSPLAALSRIECAPRWTDWVGQAFGQAVRPFATAGIGYVSFFEDRGLPVSQAESETSEPMVSYGLGARLVWPRTAALRFSAERWRGVKTARYMAWAYLVEVQFGDVQRP